MGPESESCPGISRGVEGVSVGCITMHSRKSGNTERKKDGRVKEQDTVGHTLRAPSCKDSMNDS